MSYRALLFCPDEAAARVVTQVLSELEFTVELSSEPFVTVQKLSAEPFDAVVVDCANEENAALLFKGARNSTLNHSSLCVAVVEGQMGVAKAFRIGANLVLSKPINVEQSKGTLRVARGLLRKNETKPQPLSGASASVSPSTIPVPSPIIAAQPAPEIAGMPVAGARLEPPVSVVTPAAVVPASLFEALQEKQVASGAEEPKPSEKLPAFLIQKPPVAEPSSRSAAKSGSATFAGGIPMGTAAAPAMAPEKPKSVIFASPSSSETEKLPRVQTAAPLATQESIVPEKRFPEPSMAHVPTFSSYAQPSSAPSGVGTKIIWAIICLLVLGPAGYFGWQKLQQSRYIHRAPAIKSEPPSTPSPAAVPDTSAVTANPAAEAQAGTASVPAIDSANNLGAPIVANGAPEGFPTKESIDVGQTFESPEPPITVVAKPEPLQVRQKPVARVQAPTPPSVVLPESKAPDSALAGIISSDVAVPKPAPGDLQVSEGVTQGLLIKKIAPVYPATALTFRKQGAVKLLATVSKSGTITKIKVLSGDSLLTQAAVDAVRQWKYRPFLLNAEPVDIETQITIKFTLPN